MWSKVAVAMVGVVWGAFGCDGSPSCEQQQSCDLGAGASGGGCTGSRCPAQCSGTTPVCDEGSGKCVPCLVSDDCKEGVCDVAKHECVACLTADDCGGTTPLCVNQECTGCESGADCADLGLSICQDDGSCVECTVADESACDGNSCDPKTNACTGTAIGSVKRCQACKADSECEDPTNYKCVPMEFKGQARAGGYCLKTTVSPCQQPLTKPTPSRVSLSGLAAAAYCGVDEDLTTCEAVVDLADLSTCTEDDDCGAAGLADGVCEEVETQPDRCTYRCGSSARCPAGMSCDGTAGSEYCGG